MLGLFLFNLVNNKYIFDSYKAEINHLPVPGNQTQLLPPPPLLFFFFFFLFPSCFLFSFRSLIGSSEFCSSFLIPSPSIKTLFIRKFDTFFLSSLPANCLSPSRRVSRINKLTFRKITKVQVGCLRGESLNVRWSIGCRRFQLKWQSRRPLPAREDLLSSSEPCWELRPSQAGRFGSHCPHSAFPGLLLPQPSLLKQLHRFQHDKFDCDSIKIWEKSQICFMSHSGWNQGACLGTAFTQCSSLPRPEEKQDQAHNLPPYFPKSCLLLLTFMFLK